MSSINLQEIEDLLHQKDCTTTRNGTRIQAQCPAHEDHNPSLSISEDSQGNIGIHCHAGCDTKDILSELGLRFSDLSSNSLSKSKIVAEYPYTDEEGQLLYQAIRLHPKSFRQRQPKPGGGWQWNLKGVRRVIYNLPEVLQHRNEGKPVFLVEGEKDVETLKRHGLCGTTAPMGAGKWKQAFNQYLKGTKLNIIPDNDDPGKRHALLVVRELLGLAHSISIVQLPDLKPKGDVSDWLRNGGSADQLLSLAFDATHITSIHEAKSILGLQDKKDKPKEEADDNTYFEHNLKMYNNQNKELLIADFNIEIISIIEDDQAGRIFYVRIIEMRRGRRKVSKPIEIQPSCLDNKNSFYKEIRPYSMGEIIHHRNHPTQPLNIFKWLIKKYNKPAVRRPDHVGFIKGQDRRPYWVFGNALICPPWGNHKGKIVKPNQAGEFIINDRKGFTLPLYDSEEEKQQLAPEIDTDIENISPFVGEVKTKLLKLIGGGDPQGEAQNYGKLLLAYVIYHLYEDQLYFSNDMNGHTILFYVYGPKGTGKTTYFNTILRSFFGLQKTKDIKGNSVSVPGIENIMSMYSHLPVCYDEFNPEAANVKYQHINSYYHKTARSVSDVDRKNRNKFTNIRSSLCITSNYPINLDVDQADTTQSRTIYFQYKKEYRSDDLQLFDWVKTNLHRFSGVTAHWLLNQTDEKRKQVKRQASKLYSQVKSRLEDEISQNPNQYEVEHRITDNYTRLLACYELIFDKDEALRDFIVKEVLHRFATAKANNREDKLINKLIYLASEGSLKEAWHYNYNNNQKALYIDLNQCYQTYNEHYREKALSSHQFKEILKDYLEQCGGYKVKTKRWSGSYKNKNNERINVDKTQHSYIVSYEQVAKRANVLIDIFPPKFEHQEVLVRSEKRIKEQSNLYYN